MRVVLRNPADKGTIFKNVRNLQEKKDYRGKSYQIREQLPPRVQAAKNQQRRIIRDNRQNTANQIAMSVEKGKLMVKQKQFVPKN